MLRTDTGSAANVQAQSDENRTFARFSSSSNSTQTLRSLDSNLGDAMISFPPGALNIDTEISLQHGEDITDSSDVSALGISDSDVAGSAAPVMAISEDKSVVLGQPMQIHLPLPSMTGLVAESSEYIVILYRVFDPETETIQAGLMPRSGFEVSAGKAIVETKRWGTYQAVILTRKIESAVSAQSENALKSKTGRSFLEAIPPSTAAANFESVSLINAAQDGFVSASERTSDLDLVGSLVATGYASVDYRLTLSTAACDAALEWQSDVPKAEADEFGSDGSYKVCVRLTNSAKAMTYGASAEFVLDATPPSAPSNVDDGTSSSSAQSSSQISWSVATDAGSGVSTYEISLIRSSDDSVVVDWVGTTASTSHQFTGLSLSYGSAYKARIRAKDVAGNISSIGVGDGFTVVDTNPPSAPTTLTIGSVPLDLSITPTITWQASTDAETSVSAYEVAIGTTQISQDVKDWTNIGNILSSSVTALSLTPGKTYYVQLRAVDANGNRSSSSAQSWTALGEIILRASDAGTCARRQNGKVKCWGYNYYTMFAQANGASDVNLGDSPGDLGNSLLATDLGTINGEIVTAKFGVPGSQHACFVTTSNQMKCWGANNYGQLGAETTTSFPGSTTSETGNNRAAVEIGSSSPVIDLVSNGHSTCALLASGAVKCWGKNQYGKLGQGHAVDTGSGSNQMGANLSSVELPTGRTAKAIAAGLHHVCVISDQELVYCWGNNTSGQLGHGNSVSAVGDAPSEMGNNLPITDLGGTVKAIAAGTDHSCAIMIDGSVKCWGGNSYGQLGQGYTTSIGISPSSMGTNLPAVSLGTGRTAKKIVAGVNISCAILDNNATKCWGMGSYGGLGQGNNNALGDNTMEMTDYLAPIDLGSGRYAKSLTASYHVCAVLDNNDIVCWGENGAGGKLGRGQNLSEMPQLGDGANEMGAYLIPVSLGDL